MWLLPLPWDLNCVSTPGWPSPHKLPLHFTSVQTLLLKAGLGPQVSHLWVPRTGPSVSELQCLMVESRQGPTHGLVACQRGLQQWGHKRSWAKSISRAEPAGIYRLQWSSWWTQISEDNTASSQGAVSEPTVPAPQQSADLPAPYPCHIISTSTEAMKLLKHATQF